MNFLRLLLPVFILLFFLWKSRRQPIFLLGIPFLQVMGNSIFFENLKIFWIPGRLTSPVNILMWTIIVWMVVVGIIGRWLLGYQNLSWRDLFGPPRVMPEEGLLFMLFGVWFLNFFGTMVNTNDVEGVLLVGLQLGGMFLGYVLVRGMAGNAPQKDLNDFIFALVFVNTISAFLYILDQGLLLPIYTSINDRLEIFMGISITRAFWWMPRYSTFAIAYVLSRPNWKAVHWGILIITIISIFFSYTRNEMIIVALLLVLAFTINAVKGKLSRTFIRLVLVGLAGVGLFVLADLFFHVQVLYFLARFQNIELASIGQSDNLAIRLSHFKTAYDMIARTNIWTGLGMATEITFPAVPQLALWASDFTWLATIFRYGLIGTVLIVLLYLALGIRTFIRYFQASEPDEEGYWLMFFLYLVAMTTNTFFSWTIFDTRNYTLALWFVAFIVVKTGKWSRVVT